LFIKIFNYTILAFVAVIIAGVSGLSFYIWPTGLNDHQLSITPEVVQRLRSLQAERKFGPDVATFYPGAANEEQRRAAQAVVDATLQELIAELPARPQRSTVLGTMKRALADFDHSESEERDQLLAYFSKVLDICGVQTSGELFNVWRYGFPYGWLI
jgi:hypothetical protein